MQEQIIKYAQKAFPYFVKFQYLIVGAIIVGVFAFAVYRIDTELRTERDEESYSTQLLEVKKVDFNASAAEQIRGLERSDAGIEANLDENRTNPFQ